VDILIAFSKVDSRLEKMSTNENLYFSPHVTKINKSRRMRWYYYMARMGYMRSA